MAENEKATGPLGWLRFAYGFRLPAENVHWVRHELTDAGWRGRTVLRHLAVIVRGADTSRPDLTPQCEGLLAISYGLSANYPDDHEMLEHGMMIYDALFTWCRQETQRG